MPAVLVQNGGTSDRCMGADRSRQTIKHYPVLLPEPVERALYPPDRRPCNYLAGRRETAGRSGRLGFYGRCDFYSETDWQRRPCAAGGGRRRYCEAAFQLSSSFSLPSSASSTSICKACIFFARSRSCGRGIISHLTFPWFLYFSSSSCPSIDVESGRGRLPIK